ncbi:hypothetical protein AOA80_03290 [Methanomassiliicoccales archaeon RumEn M1]|nr:hypothetical protein AOA80_03290 [Methanomassiliicoccales archaeon RumEn M1]
MVLSAASFFSMMGMSIVSPVIPDYALSFGVPFALAGLLISGFGLARLFVDLPAGMLSARFGARRFMLLGLAIIAVSSLIAGFALNYTVLLAARVLEGAGSAIYMTTSLTAVTKLSPRESRGVNLSLYMSMFLVGTMIGPVVGGFAAEHFGLGAPFTVYGLFASFSFLLVWKTIGREEVVDPSSAINLRELFGLLRRYDIATINMANVCVFVARQGILNTVVPLYARLNLGLALSELGVILSIAALGNLVTMLLSGSMTDRYGRKPFFLAGLGMTAFFIALVPFATDIVQLGVLIAGLSLSLGLAGPMAAWLTDVVRPGELGGAMGLFRTMGDLGYVVGPVALAALAGTSGSVSGAPFFLAAAVIVLLALPLVRTSDPAAARAERRI